MSKKYYDMFGREFLVGGYVVAADSRHTSKLVIYKLFKVEYGQLYTTLLSGGNNARPTLWFTEAVVISSADVLKFKLQKKENK